MMMMIEKAAVAGQDDCCCRQDACSTSMHGMAKVRNTSVLKLCVAR